MCQILKILSAYIPYVCFILFFFFDEPFASYYILEGTSYLLLPCSDFNDTSSNTVPAFSQPQQILT